MCLQIAVRRILPNPTSDCSLLLIHSTEVFHLLQKGQELFLKRVLLQNKH